MLCDGKFVICLPHYTKSSPIICAKFGTHVSKDEASYVVAISVSIPHPVGGARWISRGGHCVMLQGDSITFPREIRTGDKQDKSHCEIDKGSAV